MRAKIETLQEETKRVCPFCKSEKVYELLTYAVVPQVYGKDRASIFYCEDCGRVHSDPRVIEFLKRAKTQEEARKKFEKFKAIPWEDIPAFFGQKDWDQHCHECIYFGGHTRAGAHSCESPYGTLGCFEKYERRKEK